MKSSSWRAAAARISNAISKINKRKQLESLAAELRRVTHVVDFDIKMRRGVKGRRGCDALRGPGLGMTQTAPRQRTQQTI